MLFPLLLFFCHRNFLLHGKFSFAQFSLLRELPSAPLFLICLLFVETSDFFYIGVMDNLCYVKLPLNLFIFFLKSFPDKLMILVLDTPLVINLLDYIHKKNIKLEKFE